jgi:hypothetical protein
MLDDVEGILLLAERSAVVVVIRHVPTLPESSPSARALCFSRLELPCERVKESVRQLHVSSE